MNTDYEALVEGAVTVQTTVTVKAVNKTAATQLASDLFNNLLIAGFLEESMDFEDDMEVSIKSVQSVSVKVIHKFKGRIKTYAVKLESDIIVRTSGAFEEEDETAVVTCVENVFHDCLTIGFNSSNPAGSEMLNNVTFSVADLWIESGLSLAA